MAGKDGTSRYERVKRILDEAQGEKVPEYQGYRAFWHLPIEQLEALVLYGQRMIAEPESGDAPDPHAPGSGSCCGGSDASTGESEKETESSCCGGGDGDSEEPSPALNAVELGAQWTGTGDCWPSGGAGGGGAGGGGSGGGGGGASPSRRSQRSGLIKGLRGEAPFDGSEMPPLLWDAAHDLSESEIAFIAAWIDAGCPTQDQDEDVARAAVAERRSHLHALARGERAHPVTTSSLVEARAGREVTRTGGGLHVRKEVSTLTDDELHRFHRALQCMYRYNGSWLDERSFDFWARIHTNSCQHGWEQFLPWHRLYLYFFEQTLQDYDDRITLPYWSWSDYADVNKTTLNTTELDRGILPEAYRCSLTTRGLARLKQTGLFTEQEIADLEAVIGATYNSGLRFLRAAKIDYQTVVDPNSGRAVWSPGTHAIYDELRRANPLWFPDRWPGSAGSAAHYPTPADVDAILAVRNWADFGGGPEYDHHFGALEEVHNGMHNFAGGKNPHYPPKDVPSPDPQNEQNPQYGYMTDNRTTAFDPIFWAHHANVDRLWAVWQTMHPGREPEDLDGVLPPWSLVVRDSLSVKKLGYEYMRDAYHYPTDNDTPMVRFVGEGAGVRQSVLDRHRRAEIRLHGVRRGNLFNGIVRTFLNAPDAAPDTSVNGNDHFVGQITTFHGSCYGGPGHCDLPLPRSRPQDQRRLHHHQPRNFRIDATEAVQRMIRAGHDDLSVQLVVCDLDGTPREDALMIDGVSLCFLD